MASIEVYQFESKLSSFLLTIPTIENDWISYSQVLSGLVIYTYFVVGVADTAVLLNYWKEFVILSFGWLFLFQESIVTVIRMSKLASFQSKSYDFIEFITNSL